jgi:hypothetical protein
VLLCQQSLSTHCKPSMSRARQAGSETAAVEIDEREIYIGDVDVFRLYDRRASC